MVPPALAAGRPRSRPPQEGVRLLRPGRRDACRRGTSTSQPVARLARQRFARAEFTTLPWSVVEAVGVTLSLVARRFSEKLTAGIPELERVVQAVVAPLRDADGTPSALVHGDLIPANTLVGERARMKLSSNRLCLRIWIRPPCAAPVPSCLCADHEQLLHRLRKRWPRRMVRQGVGALRRQGCDRSVSSARVASPGPRGSA